MMLVRSIALLAAISYSANAFVVPGNPCRPNDLSLQAAAKKETVESLRKKEFVALMAEELGTTKTDAEAALTCALDIISDVSVVLFMGVFVVGLCQ